VFALKQPSQSADNSAVMKRNAWNRNIHYHDLVLAAVPSNCPCALDVGCGEGRLASELARRCGKVIAIDIDAPTIARARSTHARPNLIFIGGYVMMHDFAEESFDFLVSIATLHHLQLDPALRRFRDLLRPGGILAAIGLYKLRTLLDVVWASVATPVSCWHRLTKNYEEVAAPIREPGETLEEVRARVGRILPGAVFRRELLFRYSLVWQKPLPSRENRH
jgi:2-polyprenyl-3-methyl-5-hydroxy-6-metoxy-1,4-benzoquinol methylase